MMSAWLSPKPIQITDTRDASKKENSAKYMERLLIIFLIFCVQILNAQEKYNFDKIGIDEFHQFEMKNNSEIIDTVEFGISLNNFATSNLKKTKTIIYKRVDDDFSPKLHVWYHIDTITNNLVAITYNWDFYNPGFNPDENRELIMATNKREDEYQEKYKEVNKLLTEIFISPTKVKLINDSDYSFNEMTFWENGNLYAYSRIRFQRTIDENPMMGLVGNHFVVQMVISFK